MTLWRGSAERFRFRPNMLARRFVHYLHLREQTVSATPKNRTAPGVFRIIMSLGSPEYINMLHALQYRGSRNGALKALLY